MGKPHEGGSDFGGSDVDSDDFFHDEIDDFHADQEKMLLGDDKGFDAALSSGEEEIMPITDDDDDEDDDLADAAEEALEAEDDQGSFHKSDMESDLEDKSDDDGLPSLSAWGKKKSAYYGADFVDQDRGKSYRPEDEEKAVAEEEAGTEIFKNLNAPFKHGETLVFEEFYKDDKKSAELENVAKDLTSLSKEDHELHLKKASPEFFLLVDDFKNLMKELNERISPLLGLVEDGRIDGKGAEYIRVKHSLIQHYCMNISFYMTLKLNNAPVKYHPVMKRLSQYRKFLNQFEDIDEKLKSEIDYLLEKVKNGEDIEFNSEVQTEHEQQRLLMDSSASVKPAAVKRPIADDVSGVLKKSKKQKVEKNDQFETETEKEISSLYMDMKKKQKDAKLLLSSDNEDDDLEDEENDFNESKELEEFDNEDGDDDTVADEKRTITYEIAKNKGLLPYRKKEYRNPRVRNRMKYRRAKIRRKGQVRESRNEVTRYGGELTGIRTDVAKSIKIK